MGKTAKKMTDERREELRAERRRIIAEKAAQYGPNVVAWYPVYCGVGAEERAAEELRFQAYAVFYPKIELHHRRKRASVNAFKVTCVERPYYPRYIFVGIREGQDPGIMPINETEGVSTVVYFGQQPLSIPHKVMQSIMDKADSDGIVVRVDASNKLSRRLFDEGQQVKFIADSPFSGFIGQVQKDRGKEIKIWIDILGAENEMTVAPELLEAV